MILPTAVRAVRERAEAGRENCDFRQRITENQNELQIRSKTNKKRIYCILIQSVFVCIKLELILGDDLDSKLGW